jgi:HAD superfamily hydrolase (TIGR01450 family)
MNAYDSVLNAGAILLDWDGCVVEGGRFKPGAQHFLRAFGAKTSILSNNSTAKPGALAARLKRGGVVLPADRIHLAGQAALEITAERHPAASVWVVGEPSMCDLARKLGLAPKDGAAETLVVLLRDTRFTYRKLDKITNLLRAGAGLVVANPDLTHPRGVEIAPETGALLAAISACVDLSTVNLEIVGKPHPLLFERALRTAGVSPADALMIGDNPHTDIEGARRLGIGALLLSDGDLTLESLMNLGATRATQARVHA